MCDSPNAISCCCTLLSGDRAGWPSSSAKQVDGGSACMVRLAVYCLVTVLVLQCVTNLIANSYLSMPCLCIVEVWTAAAVRGTCPVLTKSSCSSLRPASITATVRYFLAAAPALGIPNPCSWNRQNRAFIKKLRYEGYEEKKLLKPRHIRPWMRWLALQARVGRRHCFP